MSEQYGRQQKSKITVHNTNLMFLSNNEITDSEASENSINKCLFKITSTNYLKQTVNLIIL